MAKVCSRLNIIQSIGSQSHQQHPALTFGQGQVSDKPWRDSGGMGEPTVDIRLFALTSN